MQVIRKIIKPENIKTNQDPRFLPFPHHLRGMARVEMKKEDLGEIKDQEVFEAVLSGKIIEDYPEDTPYPSCLIYGKTSKGRPLHIVCGYAKDVDKVIIITIYQPHTDRWIDFERRRK